MTQDERSRLEQRIRELEAENQRLRAGFFQPTEAQTVLVPEPFSGLFRDAEKVVGTYFSDIVADPSRGYIEIGGSRYLLLRASALSIDFLETISDLYADRGQGEALAIGRSFLFDIAHTVGVNDARSFHQRMNLVDPIQKLSAGPVHFAYTGWALVDIKPESQPSPDDDFVLYYDHPYSFEADSWLRADRRTPQPACIMNCGYSSGWCEESFGVSLTAVEVTCRARGDAMCSFVMAPPHRIGARLAERGMAAQSDTAAPSLAVPQYLERKSIEDALRESEGRLRSILEAAPMPVFIVREEDRALLYRNMLAEETFGQEVTVPPNQAAPPSFSQNQHLFRLMEGKGAADQIVTEELELRRHDGASFWALVSARRVQLGHQQQGILFTTVDVTQRKEAQRKLDQLQSRLVDASRRAGMAEIATTVLHNVGNVLNSLNASVSLVRRTLETSSSVHLHQAVTLLLEQKDLAEFFTRDPKGQRLPGYFLKLDQKISEEYDIIRKNVERLNHDVHHVGKIIEAQQSMAKRVPVVETVPLRKLLDEAVVMAKASVHLLGTLVEIECDEGLRVTLERHYALQILVNLLKNAVEAVQARKPERGRVRLTARAREGSVLIEVADNGIGFSPEVLPSLFRHGFTTKESGHGFGLHSAALATKILGGQLTARSDGEGCGATFALEIPRGIQ